MGENMTAIMKDVKEFMPLPSTFVPESASLTGRLPDAPLAMPVQSLDRVRLGEKLRGLIGISARTVRT